MVPAFKVLWSNHDEAVGHYRRYRLGALVDVLAGSGLETVQRSYFYSWLFPVALVRRALNIGEGHDGTPALLAPLAYVIGSIERFLIRNRLPIPVGSSAFAEVVRRDPDP
jgi:hypothetical protein